MFIQTAEEPPIKTNCGQKNGIFQVKTEFLYPAQPKLLM